MIFCPVRAVCEIGQLGKVKERNSDFSERRETLWSSTFSETYSEREREKERETDRDRQADRRRERERERERSVAWINH